MVSICVLCCAAMGIKLDCDCGSTKLSVKIMCSEERIKAFVFFHFLWLMETAPDCVAL